jgi:hypothetical protein
MRLFIILVPTIRYFLSIKFSIKILIKFAFMAAFFQFEHWGLLAQNLGDLPFDQVNPMLFLISRIFAQSTKIWWHCIITFLYCTIPYASSHKCIYNLEQECKYLMQSWMYPIQLCCHRILLLDSSGLLPPRTLSSTSSIGFTLRISHSVDHQVAPYLWH